MHHLFGIQNLSDLEHGSLGQLGALAKLEPAVRLGREVALHGEQAASRKAPRKVSAMLSPIQSMLAGFRIAPFSLEDDTLAKGRTAVFCANNGIAPADKASAARR